jgi:DNA polymerase-3 subunit delta'
VLILIGTSEQRQLPTIRSRCQIVRFGELPREDVVELLLAGGFCSDRQEAECWADLGEGSVQRAVEWGEPQIREFREQLMSRLSALQSELPALVAECQAFVEGAGTEAAARRARLRRVIALAAVFYRQLMRALSQAPLQVDATMSDAVMRARDAWPSDAEAAARCLDRCLDAQAHVEANASPVNVLECWLDDLAESSR